MGLRVTERTEDSVWLSHGTGHHSLHYTRDSTDAVDHVGLLAAGPESVQEIKTRVAAAGLHITADGPEGPGIEDGFTFEDAEGFAFQIYSRMTQIEVRVSHCCCARAGSVTSTSSRRTRAECSNAGRCAGFPDL